MAITVTTDVATIPAASTSPIDIPHLHTVQPQFFLNLSIGPAAGLTTGNHEWMIGVTDGTRHFSMSGICQDAATAGAPACSLAATDRLGAEMETSGNTVTGYHQFTSWDATNARITPTDAYVRARHLTWVAGSGFEGVFVDAFTTPATSADITRTGIPFAPTWAIAILGVTGSTMGATGQRAHLSLGVYDGTNQWCSYGGREEAGSNYTFGAFKTGACGLFSANSTSFADEMAFLNFTSDGGVIDRVTGSAARPMCVIWGRGGNPVVGTFAMRTTAGSISVPTTGHQSTFLLTASYPPSTASMSAPSEPCEQYIGIAQKSDRRHSHWRLDHNAEPLGGGSPTDPLAYQNDAALYERRTRTGTDTTSQAALADWQSKAHDTQTVNQTVADVASLVGWLSLGDAPAPGNGYYYRSLLHR